MHGFVQKVRQWIRDQRLAESRSRIVAAVSGGADSVAMLRALLELRFEVAVAHVDHGVRPDSAQDAEWVAGLSRTLGLEHHALQCDPGDGSEDALRRGRYRALEAIEAPRLATAHTADDQAETVLLRALRGAGTVGLSGIPPRRGRIVRPLLCVRRVEVEAFLRDLDQPWREDPTNERLDPMRNRVRHRLLPLISEELQPNAVAVLSRLADAARSDRALLEDLASQHVERHGTDLAALRSVHPGLVPHILRSVCNVPITAERMRAVLRLVRGEGGPVQLEGGVTASIDRPRAKGLRNGDGRLVFTEAVDRRNEA